MFSVNPLNLLIEEEKFRETLPDEKKIVSIYYLLMIDRCVRIEFEWAS